MEFRGAVMPWDLIPGVPEVDSALVLRGSRPVFEHRAQTAEPSADAANRGAVATAAAPLQLAAAPRRATGRAPEVEDEETLGRAV